MSLAISRTETRTGQRIHFDGFPEPTKSPQFCEGHPFAERDYALSATFMPYPFSPDVPRRWHFNGAMTDTQPKHSPVEAELEDDEVGELA
jgi:hypothetical protein